MFPLQMFSVSRKMFIIGSVSVTALLVASTLFYEVYAQVSSGVQSPSAASSLSSGTVYLAPSAKAAAQASPSAASPVLEMHIANNGLVLLRGARVLSVSGSVITVEMVWGTNTFTWNVGTTYNTEFFTSTGEKETLSNIQAGDTVTVTGMLSGSGTGQSLSAEYVREE